MPTTCVSPSGPTRFAARARFGAACTINYTRELRWGKAVRTWAGGEGVDLVVEVGGAGTLEQSLDAVRIGGQISLIGVLAGTHHDLNILPLVMKAVRLCGVVVGSRDRFDRMSQAIGQHQLRPVVDRVFSFEEAPLAFDHLRSGEHFGKVCISLEARSGFPTAPLGS